LEKYNDFSFLLEFDCFKNSLNFIMSRFRQRQQRIPTIEEPLKKIVRQRNFLGSSSKWFAARLASGGYGLQ
jgi:hypothetical protein